MEFSHLAETGLISRLLAALVVFAGLAASAAVLIVIAMMLVLLLCESGSSAALPRYGSLALRATLAALIFGVLCPPVLLVVGVPTVYCLASATAGFASAALGSLFVMLSVKGRVEDSRGG